MFSLLLAIPLTIVALITGKRIEKQLKQAAQQAQAQRTQHDDGQQHRVIDGEFEEVSR